MQFARKVIESEKLLDVIDLPRELRHSKVEVIVLPLETQSRKKQAAAPNRSKQKRNDIIDRLHTNPLKLNNFKPLSREQIYER